MALIKPRGSNKPVEQPAPVSQLAHYREKVKLDRHALDFAAEEQPELFLNVANEHVEAQSRHDELKDVLLQLDARLGREVRAEMEKGGAKATEGKVADSVLGNEERQQAAKNLAAAKVEVDRWSALRASLEHRKSMIRELATLYASGYFTAGASDTASRQVRDQKAEEGRRQLADKRKEREKGG